MEEQTELVTIPLSKYKNIENELRELEELRSFKKNIEGNLNTLTQERYSKILGKRTDLIYFVNKYGSLSNYISYLENQAIGLQYKYDELSSKSVEKNWDNERKIIDFREQIKQQKELIEDLKKEEDFWRLNYRLLLEESSLKWFQLFKRIKIIKVITKRMRWRGKE